MGRVLVHRNILAMLAGEGEWRSEPRDLYNACRAWGRIARAFEYTLPYRGGTSGMVELGRVEVGGVVVARLLASETPRIDRTPRLLVLWRRGRSARATRGTVKNVLVPILRSLTRGSIVVLTPGEAARYCPPSVYSPG